MVQLTWPHADTDWREILQQVEDCYFNIAREIALREPLLIVAQETERVQKLCTQRLEKEICKNITFVHVPNNDTWARDHAFITTKANGGNRLMDFAFNGWGLKFAADKDNMINRLVYQQGVLDGRYENHLDFVIEGGSIESDGAGTFMTTSSCLLSPNRNGTTSKKLVEQKLTDFFGAQRVLWLDDCGLAGDDTDGHIDTLARFCARDTIAYVHCDNPSLPNYQEQAARIFTQLRTMRQANGKPYRLIPLPMAQSEYDSDGNLLPATYANFLIINGAVLVPLYGHEAEDRMAMEQINKAFRGKREVVGINCRILIEQHGSLHCCTMQYPK